jgi:hypothetical protein
MTFSTASLAYSLNVRKRMKDEIDLEKKVDILLTEWKYLQDTTVWNFNIIEKQRNYGFVFIAAVFGITKASILDQQTQLWLLIPPIVIILLARIMTQLEFISVRLNRILDIEHQVSKLTGDDEVLTTESKFSSDFQSAVVYSITYAYIYLFFFSVLAFGLWKSFSYLEPQSIFGAWIYLVIIFSTAFFLFFRLGTYTLGRFKKKKEVILRNSTSIELDKG